MAEGISGSAGGANAVKLDGTAKAVDDFKLLSKALGLTNTETKSISVSMKKLNEEAKTSKVSLNYLNTALDLLGNKEKVAAQGAMLTADLLEKNSKLMSDSVADQYSRDIALRDSQIKSLQKIDGSKRAIALLDEDRAKLEMERYTAIKSTAMQSAALQIRQGQVVAGVSNGLFSAIQLRGAQAAEIGGKFLGVGTAGMGAIAGAAGAAYILFQVFKEFMSQTAQGALNAAAAGVQLTGSYSDSVARGQDYMAAIRAATGVEAARGTLLRRGALDEDELVKMVTEAHNNYADSIIAVGSAYARETDKSADARAQDSQQVITFTADMAKLSGVLGISQEEAVRLGTTLAAVSRGKMPDIEKAMYAIGMASQQLHIPITNLTDIFQLLAAQADYAGESTSQLTSETLSFSKALKEMSREGIADLDKTLSPERLARLSEMMAKMFTGMDQTKLTAMNMKPGEDFNSAMTRMMNGKDPLDFDKQAVLRIMQAYGVTNAKTMTATQMLGIGANLLPGAGIIDQARAGNLAANMVGARDFQAKALAKQLEDINGGKIDAAKSVGANLASNQDIGKVIATYVRQCLEELVAIAASLTFGDERNLAKDMLKTMRGNDATSTDSGKAYGNRSAYRSRHGMMVGA